MHNDECVESATIPADFSWDINEYVALKPFHLQHLVEVTLRLVCKLGLDNI